MATAASEGWLTMKGFCGECYRRYTCGIDPDKCDEWPDSVPMTNADRIRAMSIEELNDFLGKVADRDDDCPYEYGSVKSLEWLKKPYVQKEYKKI